MDMEEANEWLFDAAGAGNLAAAQAALDAGADFNAKDIYERTPLHWAVEVGSMDTVKLLVARGADVNASDNIGRSPKSFAKQYGFTDIWELLKKADREQRGLMDWNATERLLEAAATGNVSDARGAIDAGANVNAKAELQETPLHWAIECRALDIVTLLIDKGADVNAKSTLEQTPLHRAVEAGNFDIVKLLIAKGADVNVKNTFQETPLQLAKTSGSTEIVKLLTNAAQQHPSHAGRVTEERKDKGPPQIGG